MWKVQMKFPLYLLTTKNVLLFFSFIVSSKALMQLYFRGHMHMFLLYLIYDFSLSCLCHLSNSAEDSLVYFYSHALI